jgi:hypothetical protein
LVVVPWQLTDSFDHRSVRLMDEYCREFKVSNGTLAVGHWYRDMMHIINDTLSDIQKVIPDYDGSGYDILGFVWFQGFSDLMDPTKVAEYVWRQST